MSITTTRAVLFDAVGTLFHLSGRVGDIYARLASAHGLKVDAERLERAFHARMQDAGAPLDDNAYDWWRAMVTRVFEDERDNRDPWTPSQAAFDAFFDDAYAYFGSAGPWSLYPDARETLAAIASRDIALATVSNFDVRLDAVLESLGIRGYFDRVVIPAHVGHAKPHVAIFRHALEVLGVEAANAVHVGDSIIDDVDGATQAGIRAILIDRRGGSHRDKNAITIVESLNELAPIL